MIIYWIENKEQKPNFLCCEWLEAVFRVPKISILGPLLLNIFLIDVFLIMEDIYIVSHANDNTHYVKMKW